MIGAIVLTYRKREGLKDKVILNKFLERKEESGVEIVEC